MRSITSCMQYRVISSPLMNVIGGATILDVDRSRVCSKEVVALRDAALLARAAKENNMTSVNTNHSMAGRDSFLSTLVRHSDLTDLTLKKLRKRVNRHRVPFLNWNPHQMVVGKHSLNQVCLFVSLSEARSF